MILSRLSTRPIERLRLICCSFLMQVFQQNSQLAAYRYATERNMGNRKRCRYLAIVNCNFMSPPICWGRLTNNGERLAQFFRYLRTTNTELQTSVIALCSQYVVLPKDVPFMASNALKIPKREREWIFSFKTGEN